MKNEDGVHGLFGYLDPNNPCTLISWQDTARHVRKLSEQKKNIYRAIISFKRTDSGELGLHSQKHWREYAENHIKTLAEKNNIKMSNLGWCGAYHNEGDHPHLHIVFWDKVQKIVSNYTPPKIPNDIRVQLIKDTFEDKWKEFYERKKAAKALIGGGYEISVSITQIFNSDEQLTEAAERLFKLRKALPKSGRIAYKLLPPDVKAEVDEVVDFLLENNSYLRNAVNQFIGIQCQIKSLYTSLDELEKLNAYQNKCEADAKQQIASLVLKSVKAIISKEYELRNKQFAAEQKQFYAVECMREILGFFARNIVIGNCMLEDNKDFSGELSYRAAKEWLLKHKDRGYEH